MSRSILWIVPALLLAVGCEALDVEPDVAREEAAPVDAAFTNGNMRAMRKSAAEAKPAMGAGMNSAVGSRFSHVEGRQVAFSATLRISSPDVPAALNKANAIARDLGGYASETNDYNTTLKIPVENAEKALSELEKIGSVTSRQIRAEDVTDTMFDLDMRIANLEKLHKKLSELVEKAGGVKDILAVEQELSRVTGELERLKANRLNLQKRVDFVTFRINFSATSAPVERVRKFMLPQLASLGLWSDSLAVGSGEAPEAPFDIALPTGFVPVAMRNSDKFFAIDGEDTVISALRLEQISGADLEFWTNAAARVLREVRGYKLTIEYRTDARGNKYALLHGERSRGKTMMRYEASVRIVEHCLCADEVRIVEMLGTADRMAKLDTVAMHDSVK